MLIGGQKFAIRQKGKRWTKSTFLIKIFKLVFGQLNVSFIQAPSFIILLSFGMVLYGSKEYGGFGIFILILKIISFPVQFKKLHAYVGIKITERQFILDHEYSIINKCPASAFIYIFFIFL